MTTQLQLINIIIIIIIIIIIKQHIMKARRVEVSFHPALITTADGRDRLDSRTGRFTPSETSTDTQ